MTDKRGGEVELAPASYGHLSDKATWQAQADKIVILQTVEGIELMKNYLTLWAEGPSDEDSRNLTAPVTWLPDRTGGVALPVAHEKGRDLRL